MTYSPNQKFSIPENLYLIGTMNTADRSLAMLDYALRRRFAFVPLETDYGVLRRALQKKNCLLDIERLCENIEKMNGEIVDNMALGKGFQIGHSYFIQEENLDREKLQALWDYEVAPLLEEYFFDDVSEVEKLAALFFGGL